MRKVKKKKQVKRRDRFFRLGITFIIILLIIIILLLLKLFFSRKDFPLKLELNGNSIVKIKVNEEYKDEFVNAKLFGKNVSDRIEVQNNINNKLPGNYYIKYTFKYKLFNKSESVQRSVIVIDDEKPVISVKQDKINVYVNGKYSIGSIKATDNVDGDISSKIVVDDKNVNLGKVGNYDIKLSVSDSSDNKVEKIIKVYVNDRPIKNGTDNTRIDVYISEQKLYFYDNNKLVFTSDVVTGADDGTPTGNYKILRKRKDVYLKGKDYLDFVYYWMPFIGGTYGIHDATWRNEFGGEIYKTNGSHGCVNMPKNNMKKLYELTKIGTAVNIYR